MPNPLFMAAGSFEERHAVKLKMTRKQIIEYYEQDIQHIKREVFKQGFDAAKQETAGQFTQQKLQQLQAATAIMTEAGKMMSKAGYMIGKINNQPGF